MTIKKCYFCVTQQSLFVCFKLLFSMHICFSIILHSMRSFVNVCFPLIISLNIPSGVPSSTSRTLHAMDFLYIKLEFLQDYVKLVYLFCILQHGGWTITITQPVVFNVVQSWFYRLAFNIIIFEGSVHICGTI